MQHFVPFGKPAPKGRVQAYWQIWYQLGQISSGDTSHQDLLSRNLHTRDPLKYWTSIPNQYAPAVQEIIWRHHVVSDMSYRWKQLPWLAAATESDNVLVRKHLQYLETQLESFVQETTLPEVRALNANDCAAWRYPPLDAYLRIEYYVGDHSSPMAAICAAETSNRDAMKLDWQNRRTRANPILTGETWHWDYECVAAQPDILQHIHGTFLAWMRTGTGGTSPISWAHADDGTADDLHEEIAAEPTLVTAESQSRAAEEPVGGAEAVVAGELSPLVSAPVHGVATSSHTEHANMQNMIMATVGDLSIAPADDELELLELEYPESTAASSEVDASSE